MHEKLLAYIQAFMLYYRTSPKIRRGTSFYSHTFCFQHDLLVKNLLALLFIHQRFL